MTTMIMSMHSFNCLFINTCLNPEHAARKASEVSVLIHETHSVTSQQDAVVTKY